MKRSSRRGDSNFVFSATQHHNEKHSKEVGGVLSPSKRFNMTSPSKQFNVTPPSKKASVLSPRDVNVTSPSKKADVLSPRNMNMTSPTKKASVLSPSRLVNIVSPSKGKVPKLRHASGGPHKVRHTSGNGSKVKHASGDVQRSRHKSVDAHKVRHASDNEAKVRRTSGHEAKVRHVSGSAPVQSLADFGALGMAQFLKLDIVTSAKTGRVRLRSQKDDIKHIPFASLVDEENSCTADDTSGVNVRDLRAHFSPAARKRSRSENSRGLTSDDEEALEGKHEGRRGCGLTRGTPVAKRQLLAPKLRVMSMIERHESSDSLVYDAAPLQEDVQKEIKEIGVDIRALTDRYNNPSPPALAGAGAASSPGKTRNASGNGVVAMRRRVMRQRSKSCFTPATADIMDDRPPPTGAIRKIGKRFEFDPESFEIREIGGDASVEGGARASKRHKPSAPESVGADHTAAGVRRRQSNLQEKLDRIKQSLESARQSCHLSSPADGSSSGSTPAPVFAPHSDTPRPVRQTINRFVDTDTPSVSSRISALVDPASAVAIPGEASSPRADSSYTAKPRPHVTPTDKIKQFAARFDNQAKSLMVSSGASSKPAPRTPSNQQVSSIVTQFDKQQASPVWRMVTSHDDDRITADKVKDIAQRSRANDNTTSGSDHTSAQSVQQTAVGATVAAEKRKRDHHYEQNKRNKSCDDAPNAELEATPSDDSQQPPQQQQARNHKQADEIEEIQELDTILENFRSEIEIYVAPPAVTGKDTKADTKAAACRTAASGGASVEQWMEQAVIANLPAAGVTTPRDNPSLDLREFNMNHDVSSSNPPPSLDEMMTPQNMR